MYQTNISEKIRSILTSDFQNELYSAALKNLEDSSNKLRYNNFAYSIRELSRHFLYSLSPSDELEKCDWFTFEPKLTDPTKAQRIKYAIQGGFNNETLTELGFDIDEIDDTISSVKDTIGSLNKFTHINSDTFDLSEIEVKEMVENVLKSFASFADAIQTCRNHLTSFLEGKIEDSMSDDSVSKFFEGVDALAPHHSLDSCDISEYHISEINSEELIVKVSGSIGVTLEYGSRQERKDDDGLDIAQDFPFETKIRYQIEGFPAEFEIEDYDLDTSSWYDSDDE